MVTAITHRVSYRASGRARPFSSSCRGEILDRPHDHRAPSCVGVRCRAGRRVDGAIDGGLTQAGATMRSAQDDDPIRDPILADHVIADIDPRAGLEVGPAAVPVADADAGLLRGLVGPVLGAPLADEGLGSVIEGDNGAALLLRIRGRQQCRRERLRSRPCASHVSVARAHPGSIDRDASLRLA
jgi:hypothetical protein